MDQEKELTFNLFLRLRPHIQIEQHYPPRRHNKYNKDRFR